MTASVGPSLVAWPGGAVGLLFGLGLLGIWRGLRRHRRATLDDRLLPYLDDAPRPSRLLSAGPVTGSGALLTFARPMVTQLAGRLGRLLGGSASARRMLERAGRPGDVDRFRAEQLIWAATGLVVGGTFGSLLALRNGAGIVTPVALTVSGGALGVVGRDQWLARQATARESRMLAEFPTIAELLALAVAAGEGAAGALERVCRLSTGELSGELRRCLADARAGANLPTALQGLADRTGLVSLARFVDGMVVAVERGTPLAEVLRGQAQDAREGGRRAVMEAAGRKEIAMMLPVVFLVLPVTVVFAVFPGLAFVQLSI